MGEIRGRGWLVTLLAAAVAVPVGVAWVTGWWFVTAVSVGFYFAFLLQKGDLCGASAMSEVLLFRDGRKLAGLWVAIVTSMVGFVLIERLGWVTLRPKPMLWASFAVGGAIFGVGTVLAGGCISGCLYKAGAGNLNSMAALAGMPWGIAMVEHGVLAGVHQWLRGQVLKAGDGGPVTLPSWAGMPYWALALLFAVATAAVAWQLGRGRSQRGHGEPLLSRLLYHPWKPWQAGLGVGVLAVFAFLSAVASGRSYPLGVTHGVLGVQDLLTETVAVETGRPPAVSSAAVAAAPAPARKVSGWLILVVLAMVPGGWAAARLSGQAKLLPKPPEQIVTAFFGGILVGIGAGFATGCVVGNILSGWALLSVGTFVFGIATLLANWATTYLYLMGGAALRPRRSRRR